MKIVITNLCVFVGTVITFSQVPHNVVSYLIAAVGTGMMVVSSYMGGRLNQ